MDTAIYRELGTIAEFISMMRSELGTLQIGELSAERLPQAGRELDAIVKSTEHATHIIMECTEAVLAADETDPVAYKAFVDDKMMAIFEACSFQDLTGQRVSKVVETLAWIERRVERFCKALPSKDIQPLVDHFDEKEAAREKRKKELILNGPAMDGEGIDQAMIDDLLGTSASGGAPLKAS